METLARVEAAFSALGGEYRSRKEAAEKAVCDWRWGTWCWFDIRPLYFERSGWAPGRRLKQEPSDRSCCVACGLDHEGRVVVERQFNEPRLGYYETFYDWASGSVEVSHFDYAPEKKPINLRLARISDGRIVSSDQSAIHGYTREEYRWLGAVVREVCVHDARREHGQLSPLRPWHTARAYYTDDSVLQRVDLLWPASPPERPDDLVEIMFERRGKRIYRKQP